MDTKKNAYEVLAACEADNDFCNASFETDICSHIERHMGYRPKELWSIAGIVKPDGQRAFNLMMKHIGLYDFRWELWDIVYRGAELHKRYVLKCFAEMIVSVHGHNGEIPQSLRLL